MGREEPDEIFVVKARRCRRCGGLLTSAQALRDGYGHSCKIKMEIEEANRRMQKLQISLFGEDGEQK